MARDTAPARLLPGDYARFVSAGVLVSYVGVLALALIFRANPLSGEIQSATTLLVVTFLAGILCLTAWQVSHSEARLPWMIFGLSGLLAAFGQTSHLAGQALPGNAIVSVSWSAAYAFYVVGLVLLVQQSERGRWQELGMDVVLVAVAASVVVLRWEPWLTGQSAATAVAAITGSLMTMVLVASPPATLSKAGTLGLMGATICLLVSAILRGTPSAQLASVGMWVFLMFAGGNALQAAGRGVVIPQGERLRQFVAPGVAIILAGVAVETALHPPVEQRTAMAIGLLAMLLALRVTQLLRATRSQLAERRELVQTRALIEISRALAGTNDLDATLRTVTDCAQRVLNAKAAAIELLSAEKHELVLLAASGMPASVVGLRYPVQGSFTGWVAQNGEMRVAANATHDPIISKESAAILGKAPVAAVPLQYRERVVGVITCVGTRPFDADDLELLRAFANQAATAIEDAQLFEQVRALSVTDELTGLANRRRLDHELQREFSAARRGRRLMAVMFDLDDFKQHNDRYGHLAGDRVLRHFAEALRASTRAMNLAARFGGDEFFVLLSDTDRAGAQVFVDRVSQRFHDTMRSAGNPVVGISAGIAEFRHDMEDAVELIEAADRALYIAKSEGGTSK